MRKRVAVIGSVGVPARYGGFETLAQNLATELGSRADLTVYCEARRYPDRPARYRGARLVYLPLRANGIQSVLYDAVSMLHAMWTHDVLLLLGVSGALLLPVVRLLSRARVVVNIDGREWARRKWGVVARAFLWLSERVAVALADHIVADNAAIRADVRARYGRKAALIEYGADHARRVAPTPQDVETYPFLGGPYACTVCRVEPENNLHVILEAFRERADLPLVAVGNWNDTEYGRTLRRRYGAFPHLRLLDPMYDRRVDLLRSSCAVYVHGHSAGGTNPSLVEAMFLGRPVIAFDVIYNRETTEHRALYFRDAKELRELLAPERRGTWPSLGELLRRIAERRYTWGRVAARYLGLLDGEAPSKRAAPRPSPVTEVRPAGMGGRI
ncbi:MAG TPA: DUF1972 domain-containing protein [Planctomycetota bacterium]|nr:DUF1972 domain-containing protein [Planctomycetota bacterium]